MKKEVAAAIGKKILVAEDFSKKEIGY